jgi:lipopolysaccharide transport system permease protein
MLDLKIFSIFHTSVNMQSNGNFMTNISKSLKIASASLLFAFKLSKVELISQFRGSILGPFWIILSNLIFSVLLGLIFSEIFNANSIEYIPYIMSGLTVWSFISNQLLDSINIGQSYSGFIKNTNISIYFLVLVNLIRNFINFLIVAPVLMILLYNSGQNIDFLGFIHGSTILLIYLYLTSYIFAVIGLRFKDFKNAISTIFMVVPFATPIMWKPDLLKNRPVFLDWNPANSLINLIKSPLYDKPLDFNFQFSSYIFSLIIISIVIYINFNSFQKKNRKFCT